MILDLNKNRYPAAFGASRGLAQGNARAALILYPVAGGELLLGGGGSTINTLILRGKVIGAGNGAWRGGAVLLDGGGTTVILKQTSRNVSVFIDNVDRTEYVELGIQRSVGVGASGATCKFNLNNKGRADYSPEKFQEVLIYVGTYRFFLGIVDTVEEVAQTGTSGLTNVTVNCVGYIAMLDHRFVGRHYEIYNGGLLGIIMYDLVSRYLSDLGITWGGQDGFIQTDLIQPITFPWLSFRQVCQKFADMFTLDFYVDQFKVLRMFPKDVSTAPAPFAIATNNGLWKQMRVTRGGSYANRIGVRNSQDLGSIWTDTATGDGSTQLFVVSAELKSKPVVKVNGVAKVVTDPGFYSRPWDWEWFAFSVFQNPSATPLGPSDTLEVLYQSDIPYVAWEEDTAEIGAHGKFEDVIDVKDVLTREDLHTIAQGVLARRKQDVISVSIETDEMGIEPGQLLSINTARPLVNDDFLVQQVDSVEVGKGGMSARASKTSATKGFFQHVVKASNASSQRRTSGAEFFQKLLDQAQQPRDRITFKIAINLAETIEGLDNPGLTTGAKQAIAFAEKSGIARSCTIYFKSSETVLTTTDIYVDLLQNGVSIFPAGNPAKLVWLAGETQLQTVFIFASDPQTIKQGDAFTVNVLTADSKAKDGRVELTCLG